MQTLEEWRKWVITNKLLEDGQIWENDKSAFQIERLNNDYKVVMFTKEGDTLKFVQLAFYDNEDKVLKLLDMMSMSPSSKKLRLTRSKS